MSQGWRKYSPEFRRKALERMKACSNVTALARELGIRRKWLYKWRDQALANEPSGPRRKSATADHIATLTKRISELEQLTGRQAAEIDFFKGALRGIRESRQSSGSTGARASTRKSEA